VKPRGSRSESAEPFSPPMVEKRMNMLVFLPISPKTLAVVNRVISPVTVNVP
jgi:hypothetical protein